MLPEVVIYHIVAIYCHCGDKSPLLATLTESVFCVFNYFRKEGYLSKSENAMFLEIDIKKITHDIFGYFFLFFYSKKA